MPLFDGANRLKHVPKGNNSPFSHKNSLPKGRTNGSWVPSNKDPGKTANSYTAKEFSKQGRPKSNGYSFSGGSRGKPSAFFGGKGATHNTPPRLHGTTLHINTKGTTPHLKAKTAVSASAISKVGTTVKVVSAVAIAKALIVATYILNATAKGTSDGTLANYIGQPGETQTISEPPPPAPYGSKISFISTNNRNRLLTWLVKSYQILKTPPNDRYTHYIEAIFLDESFGSVNLDPSTLTEESLPYPEGQEPEPLPSNNSKSTTDHSKVKPEPKGEGFPPGVRPPFPSDRTSNPTPSSSFTKPKPSKSSVVKQAVVKTPEGNIETNNNSNTNNNNFPTPAKQQSKLEAPSPTPEPIPTPKPPKEKTIQEVEQPKESEAPVIISDTLTKRADGTTVRTVQKMATPEEMEEYTRKVNTAKIRNQRAAEVNQDYQNFHDLGYSSLENREPSELDKYKQEFRNKTEANTRSPFGKVDWYNMAPSPVDGKNNEKQPSSRPDGKSKEKQPQETTNRLPMPEPDSPSELEPAPPPEPVKQTPIVDDPIKEKLDKFPSKEDIALAVGGLEILRQIKDKIGGLSPLCLAPTLQPSIDRNNATTGLARAAILGQGQITQAAVNTANTTLTHPTWGLQAIVTNGAYGLQKIQGFAETAWKVTRADKIMAGVTMALTVHNAMMLSNNLASTISEALNMSLNALGIRNEEDKEIDIGTAVRNKITEVMSSILGAENYAALTTRIAKANRIYQASINLLDTTYSLFDSARTVAELTAEHTGKIGNALREAGAVYEDAYDEFLEKVNPQNASQRKLEKFREGLESVENVFDTVSQISGSVVETKENIQQIKEEKNNLVEEINTEIETKKDEKDTAKTQIQVTTEIADNDFDRVSEEI